LFDQVSHNGNNEYHPKIVLQWQIDRLKSEYSAKISRRIEDL